MKRKIIEKIYKIVNTGNEQSMHQLTKLLAKCITKAGKDAEFLCMDLHIIEKGFHFDEHYLEHALYEIGSKKLNCDEVMNKFSQYNISFPKEVTKHDVSYVLHMFLSDYGNLNIQENVLLKLVYNYIIDPDYPILNGKAFAEWKLNNGYPNIKKNKNKQAIKRNLFSLFIY